MMIPILPGAIGTQGTDASTEIRRGWDHIGAIIVDATLQRRQNYHATVMPRVVALIEAWPDAATTSGFRSRLDTGKLSDVIDWPSPGRLAQVEDITYVFERQGIETVKDLRATLGEDGHERRSPGRTGGRAAWRFRKLWITLRP